MPNIGRKMAKKLTEVGIASPEDLTRLGAKAAFSKLKQAHPQVCLVYLYALEGAIQGIAFNRLPADKRRELKEFSK